MIWGKTAKNFPCRLVIRPLPSVVYDNWPSKMFASRRLMYTMSGLRDFAPVKNWDLLASETLSP